MAFDHRSGDVAEFAPVVMGVIAQPFEGGVDVDRVTGHQAPAGVVHLCGSPPGTVSGPQAGCRSTRLRPAEEAALYALTFTFGFGFGLISKV